MKVPWDYGGVSLQYATGSWLHDRRAWTWWATMTFAKPVGWEKAAAAVRRWAQLLAKQARDHVWVAWATEQAGDGWHVHLLIEVPGTSQLPEWALRSAWRHTTLVAGLTRIERFDPAKGGAWYLVKTQGWDINVACPRFRSCKRPGTGCLVAPGSWYL